MFKKGSKIYGITKMKCPKCHEGDLFVSKGAYKFSTMSKMHDNCTVCGQSYSPEPNFYYGAMYVSYGYSVAVFAAVYLLTVLLLDIGMWQTVGLVGLVLVLLSPYVFRLSRSTYIHVFVHFNKDAAKRVNR